MRKLVYSWCAEREFLDYELNCLRSCLSLFLSYWKTKDFSLSKISAKVSSLIIATFDVFREQVSLLRQWQGRVNENTIECISPLIRTKTVLLTSGSLFLPGLREGARKECLCSRVKITRIRHLMLIASTSQIMSIFLNFLLSSTCADAYAWENGKHSVSHYPCRLDVPFFAIFGRFQV